MSSSEAKKYCGNSILKTIMIIFDGISIIIVIGNKLKTM